jgi:hypothetical protein
MYGIPLRFILKNTLTLIFFIIPILMHYPTFFAFSFTINYLLPSKLPSQPTNLLPFAFHKDPDDLTCICPLGIGTAVHCLAGSLIMTIFHKQINEYLLPTGQFGIAVPGSTNFVIHSTLNPLLINFSPNLLTLLV